MALMVSSLASAAMVTALQTSAAPGLSLVDLKWLTNIAMNGRRVEEEEEKKKVDGMLLIHKDCSFNGNNGVTMTKISCFA